MNPVVKTAIYVAAAAGLAVVAILSSPGGVEPEFFSDVGEPFFPHLQQPDQAASLEIWGFDAETGAAVPFSVKRESGVWTIPSHHDYPADAKDRMAKAAGLFVGLTRASVRSDRKEDHARFGVVDPTDESLETEGRGMRVTFKDKAGAVLADMILGNEVEGHSGTRYVRLADKKRVYTAELPGELSTKFEDWIERDLLKVGSWDIQKVIFDNYSVDEDRGVVVEGEKVTMQKKDHDWTLPDLDAAKEEIDVDKASEAVSTLTDLKIVDVRRKPEGLTAQLERARGISREILMESLARRGFFVARDKLYSNEGDLLVQTKKGVVYTLKFGEIVYGSGEPVEATGERKETGNGEKGEAAGDGEKSRDTSRRYLMITAHFDESLLEKPAGTPLSQEEMDRRKQAREQVEKIAAAVRSYRSAHGKLPAALGELTQGDAPLLASLEADPWGHDYGLVARPPAAGPAPPPDDGTPVPEESEEPDFVVRSLGADGAEGGDGANADLASDAFAREDELRKVFDAHEAYRKKVEEGRAEAEKLSARFGPWYYVIDAESFGKLHLSRSDLVKPVEGDGEGAESTEEKEGEKKDGEDGEGGENGENGRER